MSGATGQPGLAPPTPRRRRIVAACVVVGMLVLAAGAGAAWWLGVGLPQPPAVDASGREPEIASAIAAARAEVQRQPRSGKAWGRLGLLLLAHDYEPEARVCLARAE